MRDREDTKEDSTAGMTNGLSSSLGLESFKVRMSKDWRPHSAHLVAERASEPRNNAVHIAHLFQARSGSRVGQ